MIFKLFLLLFIILEVHKIIKHNLFFRLNNISLKYGTEIRKRGTILFINDIIILSFFELSYYIISFIGLYTENYFLFIFIIIIPIITNYIILKSKYRKFNRFIFILGGLIKLSLLSLVLADYYIDLI